MAGSSLSCTLISQSIRDIDSFYTWFDLSLTAESSFNKFFRTGEAAADFSLYATSNNTFSVLSVAQTRTSCFTADELQGSGADPTGRCGLKGGGAGLGGRAAHLWYFSNSGVLCAGVSLSWRADNGPKLAVWRRQ
jgi:hypothetical protein